MHGLTLSQEHTGQDVAGIILPQDAGKDAACRLSAFARWMEARRLPWYAPDLAGYREDLLGGDLSPATVSAYLSTVRAQYKRLILDNDIRGTLYDVAGEELARLRYSDTPANRKALGQVRMAASFND